MSDAPSAKTRNSTGKPLSSTSESHVGNGRSDSSMVSTVASSARKGAKPEQSAHRRRATVAHELGVELIGLRGALQEMVERYQVRVGGQLEELIACLSGESALDQPPRLPTLRRMAQLEQVLRETKLKPKKGRPKDFERLEATVAKLIAVLEE